MSTETYSLSTQLLTYLRSVGMREDEDLRRLRAETATQPMAIMQISPEQGQFMRLLVELMDARKALEIGTFTGYSAMCIAKGMGPTGRLVALDISEEYTAVARRHWNAANVVHRIDLRVAPALDSLVPIVRDESGTYDFIFVDADKPGYDAYYERSLKLLRVGGLALFDNAFMEGGVVRPTDLSADTVAMRAFNQKLVEDPRVTLSMIPISDGLTLVRRRY